MEKFSIVSKRRRYLRGLLMDQLSRFEIGRLKMHANDKDVSRLAIVQLKREIAEFDALICERREACHSQPKGG
jgi:hypothetical protein